MKNNISIMLCCIFMLSGCNAEKPSIMMEKTQNSADSKQSASTALRRNDDSGDVGGGGGGGGGGGPVSPPKLAVHTVSWNDFSHYVELPCERHSDDQVLCPVDEVENRLPDNDHIWFKEETGNQYGVSPSEIEIVLTSAANVTWWKEIKAFNSQGQELGWIQTQDAAHGPVSMRLDAGSVNSLVFSKAKELGIHTGMYQVFDVSGKRSKRLAFEWKSD